MKKKNLTEDQINEDVAMKNAMEKMVDTYDAYMKKTTRGKENELRDMTVNYAQIKPGDSVLEVGCATGSLTLAAKRKVGPSGKVFGIDVIPGMIEKSKQKAVEANLEITFKEGNIENIPFPDNNFDVVMCSFMIFHMSDAVRRKGISEIFRVLKPQGKLMILDIALPQNPVSRVITKILIGFMLKHDLNELLPIMQSVGFTGVEILQAKYRLYGFPILSYVRGSK